jgi:xanthine dehydrogenase molybdopterin-binding subunit B
LGGDTESDFVEMVAAEALADGAEKLCGAIRREAVGEPPLMPAFSVREAIGDAVANFGAPGGEVLLASPATGESIFVAVQGRLNPHL